ncbi:hypothetical protein EBR21_13890, partial [bacterium]|nr:hypothetical protein [bacterium]
MRFWGFFMAKRFVFGILAIGLLLMAVFKCSTRKSNGSGIHQSPSASSGQQLTWINKSLVIIKRSQLGQDAQLHDIFLLKQKVDSGESCSVGLFRLIKKNEEKGTLKFIGTRLSSRFEIWAEAQGKRIEWQWQAIKGNDLLAPPEQQCWLWRKDGNVRQQPLVVVERDRFFIRGSQYAEVVEGGRGRFKIDNDHFRRGW